MSVTTYRLVAEKREWLPEIIWRYLHPLALIYPFRWIMVRELPEEEE